MRIGDKVCCIKTRCVCEKYEVVNMAGMEYYIIKILGNKIFLSNDRNSDDTYFYVLIDNGINYYYEEYFSSLKEYRKLKLKKLNERR